MLDREREGADAGGGDLVVASWWSFLALRDRRRFPPRAEEASALEAAENGIDGAARELGGIHDVESVFDAGGDRLEDGDGGR
jgi:hypothetical protein